MLVNIIAKSLFLCKNLVSLFGGVSFFLPASLQALPHLTKRAPDAGDSAAFSSIFLRLSIFPIGRRPAARPSAGNANR
jgi:hypothetical protein